MACAQVGVGGRDDPHPGPPRRVGSQPLELAGLQHPQQLGLAAAGQIAQLIQKQRAAVGRLEAPVRALAPVNAPVSVPNSSASMSSLGSAPRFTFR